MSSIRTRKTKARFVFTLFSKLDVEYNSQPKMSCKFCKWTVTKNATRMATHIISACKYCPADIKKNVYMIQTKDIKQPHLSIKDEIEKKFPNNDDELTRISATSYDDSVNNIDYKEIASNMADDIVIEEEVVEFGNPLSDSHTETHTYSKPNLEKSQADNNKYKFTLISNNDTNSNKLNNDSTLNLKESNDLKCDDYKKESKAFGNWVTSEIDEIGDLEILNQMKHDISIILYNSKKEYLQKLKQSGWSCEKIKSLRSS